MLTEVLIELIGKPTSTGLHLQSEMTKVALEEYGMIADFDESLSE